MACRINTSGAVGSLPSVTNLTTGTSYFSDGTPAANDGTPLCASWGNMVQEEICNGATVRGASLSTSDRTQLATVLRHANAIRSATQAGSLSGDDADSTGGFPHVHVAIACLDASVSGGMAGQLASNTCTTSGVRGVAVGSLSCVASGNSSTAAASESSTASGDLSAVVAADTSTASGDLSFVTASAGCTASGTNGSAVVSSVDTLATGARAVAIACNETTVSGTYSAAIACNAPAGASVTTVSGARSVLLASLNCELNTGYSIAGGYNAGGAITPSGADQNLTFRVDVATGTLYYDTALYGGAADFAEYFPTLDAHELPVGRLVAGAGKSVRLAQPKDTVRGVVSATPGVIGNAAPHSWSGRWQVDAWGRRITQQLAMVRWRELVTRDAETGARVVTREGYEGMASAAPQPVPADAESYTITAFVEVPNYDASKRYVPRAARPDQWCPVALTGQVPVAVDGKAKVGDMLTSGVDGIGTPASGQPRGRPVEVLEITSPFDAARGYGIALCLVG